MGKKLIITEKPSVAQDYAKVFQVSGKRNGYIENNTYVITWCVGHLVEMVYPEEYDIRYKKWVLQDLPFLPEKYKYGVIKNVQQQYDIVHSLLQREDIDTVYWAGDSGKEGQTSADRCTDNRSAPKRYPDSFALFQILFSFLQCAQDNKK